ncbi:hypothetical protein KvSKV_14990 (plasmid) [Ketogulonicigenium vulgare]|nr:hypothetical protein KvSKV_14990 [Ketogulonicigenium vulgare]
MRIALPFHPRAAIIFKALGEFAMLPFDHGVINTLGEMDQAAARYTSLGFALTPRGYHTLGSINHLAVFGDTYLELLGYAPGERSKRAELWVHPPGLSGLALRPDDAAALHTQMVARGLAVEPLKDFSRPVEVDGATCDAAFRTFQLDRGLIANGRFFFCQHKTPELIWRAADQQHPNGAQNIRAAYIAANNPQVVLDLLAQTPGLSRAGNQIKTAQTTLIIDTPKALALLLGGDRPDLLPDLLTEPMRMVALDITCTALDQVAQVLETAALPYTRADDAISLTPEVALGLFLRFVPA